MQPRICSVRGPAALHKSHALDYSTPQLAAHAAAVSNFSRLSARYAVL